MTQVYEGLYMCGAAELGPELEQVRPALLVSLAAPFMAAGGAEVFLDWAIEDGPLPDLDTLDYVTRFVAMFVHGHKPVVTHCAAGMNRAGLVCGGAVRLLARVSGSAAVEAVRAQRPGALSNEKFAHWLERQAAP